MAEEAAAMATSVEAQATVPETGGKPVGKKKTTATKIPKALKDKKDKKPPTAKAGSPSHPAYFLMIKDAILALKEKGGSSPYAIAKHMEEKYKSALPANFRKMLAVQLKNCLTRGRLVKVKGSFKLSEEGKKVPSAKKIAAPGKDKKSKVPATKVRKPKMKPTSDKKRKASTPSKAEGGKVKKLGAKKIKKATTAKPKQPKSIKSPAVKRARKTSAA